MRERGAQSRRAHSAPVEPVPGPPRARGGGNVWQVVAIIALIAATAGWTTVAVIALREPSTAVVTPSDSFDPNATGNASIPPAVASHDVPALEALLPPDVNGTTLQAESLTGETLLNSDDWSAALTKFLTSVSKTSTDLQYASAADPNGSLDLQIGVYRVVGLDTEATGLRDALVEAWKTLSPDLKISQVTLGGKALTKGDNGGDFAPSYLFVRGNLVYEIDSGDEAIVIAALAALPESGASASPGASRSPAAPASPKGSPSPAP